MTLIIILNFENKVSRIVPVFPALNDAQKKHIIREMDEEDRFRLPTRQHSIIFEDVIERDKLLADPNKFLEMR